MNQKLLIRNLIVLLFCTAAVIQARASDTLRLSLDEAVRIAIQQNHDLQAAQLEVTKAQKQVNEAFGLALPSIDFSAQYTRAIKRPVFFLPDFENPSSGRVVPIEIGSKNSFDLSLSASQILFNSAVFTGVGTARIYLDAAKEMYRAKFVETVASVRRAYYAVLLQRDLREIQRATMANATENLRVARSLAAGGLISEYDALRAEVRVENLKPELMRAEDTYAITLNNLRIAMGVPVAKTIDVIGSLDLQVLDVDEAEVSSAPATAAQSNPVLSAMRHQADVNDAIVSIERSDYLPTLAAFGNYQYQGQKNDFSISTNDFISSSVVGLNLSLSIFKGFQTNARVQQAEMEYRKSLEQIAAFESALRTQVESIIMRLRWAQKQIGVHEHTIELAERGYRIASTRFANGSGTQLELNDAQLALDQAKLNRAQAIYQLLLALTDLDAAVGSSGIYTDPNKEN